MKTEKGIKQEKLDGVASWSNSWQKLLSFLFEDLLTSTSQKHQEMFNTIHKSLDSGKKSVGKKKVIFFWQLFF